MQLVIGQILDTDHWYLLNLAINTKVDHFRVFNFYLCTIFVLTTDFCVCLPRKYFLFIGYLAGKNTAYLLKNILINKYEFRKLKKYNTRLKKMHLMKEKHTKKCLKQ